MENSKDNKPVNYQCNGVNWWKKKGKHLDYYIKYKLRSNIEVEQMNCNNICEQAPVLHLHPEDIWFSEKDLGTIVKKHILNK